MIYLQVKNDCRVIPVELVAVKVIVPIELPPENEPNEPALVVQAGASDNC